MSHDLQVDRFPPAHQDPGHGVLYPHANPPQTGDLVDLRPKHCGYILGRSLPFIFIHQSDPCFADVAPHLTPKGSSKAFLFRATADEHYRALRHLLLHNLFNPVHHLICLLHPGPDGKFDLRIDV